MSWSDVDKKTGGANAGRFIQFPEGDGTSIKFRVLDDEPYTTRVHKISQVVKKGDKTEEVFRSIPATANPDENFILKSNPKRYPDVAQFNLRVHEFKVVEGKHVVDGEVKILQGGPGIFKPMRGLFNEFGHLNKFDIVVTRKGKGRDTEYTVSAAPFSLPLDVVAATQKMLADPAWSWDNIFVPVTAAEQQKILIEAGFDVMYDPAAKIAESMTLDQARAAQITFGKYKGKTAGEVQIIDSGYLQWAADNITSNDIVQAACRVLMGGVAVAAAKVMPVQQQLPPSTPTPQTAPVAPTPAPAPAATEDKTKRSELTEALSDAFESDPKFADMSVMVELVKKHGGGKSRLKDLTVAQLTSLYGEVVGG